MEACMEACDHPGDGGEISDISTPPYDETIFPMHGGMGAPSEHVGEMQC